MELPKKKRCRICRKKFRPDPRVGPRQQACSRKSCQQKRRAQTQASWRARNPAYPKAYQLKKRATLTQAASDGELDATGEPVRRPEPLAVPSPLESIPWDFAQDEIGVVATDLLALLGLLLLRLAKDQRKGETPLSIGTYTPVSDVVRKDE